MERTTGVSFKTVAEGFGVSFLAGAAAGTATGIAILILMSSREVPLATSLRTSCKIGAVVGTPIGALLFIAGIADECINGHNRKK